MEKIAFILGGTPVYWRTVLIALGALSFALMLIGLRLRQGRKLLPVLIALPFAGAAALYLGRFIQWYCLSENYASLGEAFSDLGNGGVSLVGAFGSALLFALLLRLVRLEKDTPALLDDVSVAGALGIAAGRLGELFGSADRGKFVIENAALRRLPFSAVTVNPVSGAEEWRFATFCAQSLWAFVLFIVLMSRLAVLSRRGEEDRARAKGRGFLLFLTLYCEGQILLDSTRYDALFLRSNGFVSFEQILCCIVITAIMAAYSLPGLRSRKKRLPCLVCWGVYLGGFGLVGFMEYYVQRHGGAYVLSYSLMAVGLAVVFGAMRLADILSARKTKTINAPASSD